LADFQNSSTDILVGKFAMQQSLNISPHLKCVATLPRKVHCAGGLARNTGTADPDRHRQCY